MTNRLAPRRHRLTWAPSAIIDKFELPDSAPYTQCLALGCPDDFHAIRVGLPNVSAAPYRISRIVARPSDSWSDYLNPTGDSEWTPLTFVHGGQDVEAIVSNAGGPTETSVAARAEDLASGETYIPKWTWSDWRPVRSLPPAGRTNDLRVLMLRMALPQNQTITFASSGFLGYTGNPELNRGFDFATAKWPEDIAADPRPVDAERASIGQGVNSMACVQFLTSHAGVTGIVTGDSHHAGTTTTAQLLSFGLRAAVSLGQQTVGALPLGYVTCATGGSKSQQFFPRLHDLLPIVRPGFVVMPGWTYNDTNGDVHADDTACNLFFARLLQAADACEAYGAIPIFLTPFPRDKAAMGDVQLACWKRLRNDVLALREAGAIVLDTTPLLSQMHGGLFDGTYLAELTNDQVHPNDAGHALVAKHLMPILRTLCGVQLP